MVRMSRMKVKGAAAALENRSNSNNKKKEKYSGNREIDCVNHIELNTVITI